jgi:hypothetical protein
MPLDLFTGGAMGVHCDWLGSSCKANCLSWSGAETTGRQGGLLPVSHPSRIR